MSIQHKYTKGWTAIRKFIDFHLKNHSIRNKLLFFFLLLSLGPIAIIGSVSFLNSRAAITNKITKYSLEALNQTTINLGIQMKYFEDISTQLISNRILNEKLLNFITAESAFDRVTTDREITDFLNGITLNVSAIGCALFINESDSNFHIRVGELVAFYQFIESFKKSKVYQDIIKADGRLIWAPPTYISESGKCAILGRRIKHTLTGKTLGVFVILVKEKELDKIINSSLYKNEDISNGKIKGNYALIINNQGTIISTPFKEDIGRPILKIFNNPRALDCILKDEEDEGSFSDKIQNKQVLVTYEAVGKSGWYLLNITPTSYLFSETSTVGWLTLIFGLGFGVIAVGISFYVAVSISNPLNQVVSAMKRAEVGDFSARVKIPNRDELGFLANSFNYMLEKIGELINDTRQAIEAVLARSADLEQSSAQSAQTSESVAAAMQQISSGTLLQTSEAEKSSQQMQELADQIDNVAVKAGEVRIITGSTKELSFRSKEAVKLLIEKTSETDQITNEILKDINALNTSAAEIHDITNVITTIAEQTTLLALNASIEAARAGEMGQGFAVVADEVNKLAAQSRNAAKTINTILQTIQAKTEASSKTANSAFKIVEDQMNAVLTAQKSFDEIITAMDNVVTRVSEMNEMIEKIGIYKDKTVNAIMSISSISEQTAASSEEVSASSQEQIALAEQVKFMAEELRGMAEKLVGVIAKFRLG
jgi:methyl-accepting chemotaxis protein